MTETFVVNRAMIAHPLAYSSEHMSNKTGELISQKRKALGWVQQDVADKAETTRKHISRIEGGKDLPSREMASRIAEALGIPVQDIFSTLAIDTNPKAIRTREPVVSVLREIEDYHDLDNDYREALEKEFQERQIDTAELLVAKWIGKQKRRERVGDAEG